MATKEKSEILPSVTVDHDREKYHIEIELPGVEKEKIELEVGEQSFCVRASREDIVYNACYTMAHSVDPDKAEAIFEDDVLKVTAPLKSPIRGRLVKIR